MLSTMLSTKETKQETAIAMESKAAPLSKLEALFGEERTAADARSRITPSFLATVLVVYLLQGSLGIIVLGVRLWMMSQGESPADVAVLMGTLFLPWIPKFAYGFMSDSFPVFGYHRKPYLLLAGAAGAAALIAAAAAGDMATRTAKGLFILLWTCIAFADVIADALMVEKCEGKPRAVAASLQSFANGCRAVGGIISSFGGGALMDSFGGMQGGGARKVLGVCAVFPALLFVAALILHEPKATSSLSAVALKEKVMLLFRTLLTRNVALPMLFVFALTATPTASESLTFFFVHDLEIQPSLLGMAAGWAMVGLLLATLIYQRYLQKTSLRKVFFWSTVLSFILGFLPLVLVFGANQTVGLADEYFILSDSFVQQLVSMFQMLAVLVLCSQICPPGIEGALFATLMGLLNAAQSLSNFFSALMAEALGITCETVTPVAGSPPGPPKMTCDFSSLMELVILCNVTTLLPLLLLFLVPSGTSEDTQSQAGHELVPTLDLSEGGSDLEGAHLAPKASAPEADEVLGCDGVEIHGIRSKTVVSAPPASDVLPVLEQELSI